MDEPTVGIYRSKTGTWPSPWGTVPVFKPLSILRNALKTPHRRSREGGSPDTAGSAISGFVMVDFENLRSFSVLKTEPTLLAGVFVV